MKKRSTRIISLALALALPLASIGNPPHFAYAAGESGAVVNFPDANLKQALLDNGVDTNGDGQITREELAARADPLHMATGLDSLSLANRNIQNLSGLEYAVNVRTLALSGNPITDLTPLASMSSLETLGLSGTPIQNVSPLGNLPGLRFMELSNSANLDLNTIASLTNLEYLYLDQDNIRDIKPLASLTKLKVLHMFHNQISDLSPLAGLSDLREVSIRSNLITEISAFANKPYMHTLWLSDNQINDVGGLKNVPSLRWLELDYNRITDISSFSALTSMQDMTLDYNAIADISPLAAMTKLERLSIYENRIESLAPLAGLTKLTGLYIGMNRIRDISPLARLTALKHLLLDGNPLQSIEPLRNLTGLVELGLTQTQSRDISALSGLTSMKELYLENNGITSIAPLSGMTSLYLLYVRNNPIADASVLLKLTSIRDLKIDGGTGSSIGPVVTGVAEGEFYNTDRTITFDRGTAQLNDKPFASGTTVSAEGAHYLYVRDQTGLNTGVHFVIDKTAPAVTGVANGTTYDQAVTIGFNEGTAVLNGKSIGSGVKVEQDGQYTLIVTDQASNRTIIAFTVRLKNPVVRGVADGGLYSASKVISFDQGTATLDGVPFASGGTVSAEGTHTLIVTGKDGKKTTIVFTIKKGAAESAGQPGTSPADISGLKGVSGWAKPDIEAASLLGLTIPVQNSTFTDSVTREQFSAIAVKLYESLTGEKGVPASPNPFKDTGSVDVLTAFQLGIVKGTSADKFSPRALITREQLAVMLMRVMDQSGYQLPAGTAKSFKDRGKFSSYAVSAIDYLSSAGVITGLTATTFEPKRNATIEQAVIMANRASSLLKGHPTTGTTTEPGTAAGSGPGSTTSGACTTGAGSGSLYAFDGSAFELYVQKSYPQPDGTDFKEYAVRNACSFTLPAYSAIYVAAGSSTQKFEDQYYNYNYGGYVLVANHTDKPRTIEVGAADYSVRNFYRDNMGTITYPDGTNVMETATGPYVRLIAFDRDFDESKPYKEYLDQQQDLYRGDWITVKPTK